MLEKPVVRHPAILGIQTCDGRISQQEGGKSSASRNTEDFEEKTPTDVTAQRVWTGFFQTRDFLTPIPSELEKRVKTLDTTRRRMKEAIRETAGVMRKRQADDENIVCFHYHYPLAKLKFLSALAKRISSTNSLA